MSSTQDITISDGSLEGEAQLRDDSSSSTNDFDTPSLIKLLVQLGGQLYMKDCDGLTPLHIAIKNSNLIAIRALVEAGADINWGTREYNARPPDSIIEISTPSEATIPHFAVVCASLNTMSFLLDLGVRVNAKDFNGRSLLHKAVFEYNFPLIELLIQRGADLSSTDDSGQGLLHVAVEQGNTEICQWLLKKGLDIDLKDRRGWTPLHLSAWCGYTDICRILLDHNADPKMKTRESRSALHLAAWQGNAKIAGLLLDYKASVNPRDAWGRTPLYYANRYRHARQHRHETATADLLRSKGGVI